jgi:cell division protein FtsZ
MEGRMRVSVVATGIDAVAKTSDQPVPRRPMATPLTQHVTAEDRAVSTPVQAPRPAQPAVAAQVREPLPQRVAQAPTQPAVKERNLFEQETAADPTDDIFDQDFDDLDADGVPAPAYRPAAEPAAMDRAEDSGLPAASGELIQSHPTTGKGLHRAAPFSIISMS